MKMKPVNRTLTTVLFLGVLLAACTQNQEAPATKETIRREPVQAVQAVQTPVQQAAAITGESSVKMSGGTTSKTPAETAAVPDGEQVYNKVCVSCHGTGIAGAPKVGDKETWKPRIARGMQTLVNQAIKGFTGEKGVMPPKGGAPSLSDAEVEAAVRYMVVQSR
jgi:cytochrome c5